MIDNVKNMNSLELDSEWLLDRGYKDVDAEKFSDWVSRLMADDVTEEDARLFVIENLVINCFKDEDRNESFGSL